MAKKARRKSSVNKAPQKWHAVPLKGSFMVLSIIGFLITAYLVPSSDYKIAFMIVFVAMFIASMVSMTKAPSGE
ncbi:hypothetical protein HY494_02695 [Candidatus Woesearchaeota archaeon]|nr:hypothetical protein [Candidatus Woesearchaeota archaeon]